ncbi:unnamed protein product [Heterobilharzia americana]|nr:unnamed protein product [Heterobilharzia americana]CAH8618979.1 unnamed protein product [Heterobilharzia americana]
MDNSEIMRTNDATVIKRKKTGKFGRFLSHFKRKSHHTTDSKSKTSMASTQPSTETISTASTHVRGCSTFSNWFTRGRDNVHDKRPTVKQKKYKEVPGTVIFDQTSCPDVYDRILKNSILGTKLAKKAVICSRNTGAINAYGPEDFTPSVEQINKVLMLSQAERADRVILDKHFQVGMDTCVYKDIEDDTGVLIADIIQYYTLPDSVTCNVGKYELAGLLTKNSLLIAIYEVGHRINESKKLLIEIRDYLDSQGM